MIRLVCGNCGKEGRFATWEEAFERNWDTVERFGYNACDDCPGVSVYLPMYYAQKARAATNLVDREAFLIQAEEQTMKYDPRRTRGEGGRGTAPRDSPEKQEADQAGS